MWKCPNCNRQFVRRNQSHTCVTTTIDSLLEGKPGKFKNWVQIIILHLSKFGHLRVDTSLSCINLKSKSSFAALKFNKNTMDIEFLLDREEDTFPIYKIVSISKSQYAHVVRLEEPSELNDQLLSWLSESFLIRQKQGS
jgi:hypothetical protein